MENSYKTMSALAAKRDPTMNRLAALRTYQKLSPEARKMVKAVILRDADPELTGCGPNWRRIWNSDPVLACLADYGYTAPKRPLQPIAAQGVTEAGKAFAPIEAILAPSATAKASEVPEVPCGKCGTVGAHTSRHNSLLVCNACLCRASNIRTVTPPKPEKCWECGADAQPTWDGRWLCPTHFASSASSQAQQSTAELMAAVARRNVLANQGRDMNTCDLAAQRGMDKDNNYSRSVQIWQQQDAEGADKREQERQERDAAETRFHNARADWIQRGGKL
jgi:hypothetical protein